MKKFLLSSVILILAPACALAGPCPSPTGTPCLPDPATIKTLLDEIGIVGGLKSAIESNRVSWQYASRGDDRDEELGKFEAYLKSKVEFEQGAAKLVKMIQDAYNVAPPLPDGTTKKPRGTNGAMDWMGGINTHWAPRMSPNSDDVVVMKTRAGTHYESVNTDGLGGVTMPDGQVLISSLLLSEAIISKNPGEIAQIIYHEGIHFKGLITTGTDTMEQDEVDAYSAVEAHDDVFLLTQLSPASANRNADELARSKAALMAGKGRRYIVLPEAEKQAKVSLDQQHAEEVDLARYYADLKAQVAKDKAGHESDERLRKGMLALAQRSCDAPGSVSQAEIDALPQPYQPDFIDHGPYPVTQGECVLSVYGYLGKAGATARELTRLSTPPQKPIDLTPLPSIPVAQPVPPPPLSDYLPTFKAFAVSACASPEQVSMEVNLYRSFNLTNWAYDDMIVKDLKVGMSSCQSLLFQQVIDAIRDHQAIGITREWIRRMVAIDTPAPNTGMAPGSTSPGQDEHIGPDPRIPRGRIRDRFGNIIPP